MACFEILNRLLIVEILCLFEITKNIVLLENKMYNILKSKKLLEKKGFLRYTSIMSYSQR